MSAALSAFIAKLIETLIGDIVDWARKIQAEKAAQKAVDEAALASVQPLKDAKTGQEVSNATDSTLNGV